MPPQSLSPREILDRLVAFPTVSRDSNLDLVDWVEDYLSGHGVTAHRVWNADRSKAAIYANVGPEVAGGTVLSGHTDVVPVDGQPWATDPFRVTEKDGRLYGRGTCDMKGFDALALAAVPMALKKGVKRPLQIALSYDEEVGCVGAPPMIADMVQRLPKAAAVVVGEPSMMRLVNGHKGGAGYNVTVRGFEVHSSLLPYGVSAIMEAARLVGWMNDRNAEIRSREPSTLAAMFHPPFTTIHCGKFHGGTAANITAGDCTLSMEFRVVPGEDPDLWARRFEEECARIETQMTSVRPEARITLERYFDVPALAPEKAGEAEALVRRVTGDNGTSVVSYGTEAGQFQAEGYSCVVCGPGDIAQAHQVDEYCTVAQFEAGWDFMDRLTDDLAA